MLKCEDLNYGSVCSKCLRYQIISYSPLVLLSSTTTLGSAHSFRKIPSHGGVAAVAAGVGPSQPPQPIPGPDGPPPGRGFGCRSSFSVRSAFPKGVGYPTKMALILQEKPRTTNLFHWSWHGRWNEKLLRNMKGRRPAANAGLRYNTFGLALGNSS